MRGVRLTAPDGLASNSVPTERRSWVSAFDQHADLRPTSRMFHLVHFTCSCSASRNRSSKTLACIRAAARLMAKGFTQATFRTCYGCCCNIVVYMKRSELVQADRATAPLRFTSLTITVSLQLDFRQAVLHATSHSHSTLHTSPHILAYSIFPSNFLLSATFLTALLKSS